MIGSGGTFEPLLPGPFPAPLRRARRTSRLRIRRWWSRRSALTPPVDGLLGPSLIVDPQQDDENDWDIGLRKQQVVAVATRAFSRTAISVELRAERSGGRTSCPRSRRTWSASGWRLA